MTGSAQDVARAAEAVSPTAPPGEPIEVTIEAPLSDRWFEAYQRQRPEAGDSARSVLTGSPEQLFGGIEVDGRLAAVARVAFAHAWAGVFAVEVEPSQRRRGLATVLTGALAREARARGIRSLYLQVSDANAAAVSAYEALGFSTHHTYVYLTR